MTAIANSSSKTNVSRRDRGVVVWLTGLSGAGKTTIAEALAEELRALGEKVEVLDGDVVRTHLSRGLGFSREDRDENVARIAFVAHLLARNGVFVLVAAVSPYHAGRDAARALIGDFVEVHVAPPLDACVARDVKGLYAKALAGEIPRFTGVSDPYEAPERPELTLDTSAMDVTGAVRRVRAKLSELGWLDAPRGAGGELPRSPIRARTDERAMTTTLPRFSDPRDIDEFVAKLSAFERGEIGPDEFRAFRLVRGVYGQRQQDRQMLRVKIPFGRLDEAGLVALADVADRWSRGFGHVTTRQNVQFHFVAMSDVETAMRRLDEAGLTTREACGNSVRAVTACELAEVCASAPFDVSPYAEAITRHFLRHPLAASLPRKFKIAFSGCASDCAKAAIHDLGFVAEVRDGEKGFRVVAGGGLSSSPRDALVIHEWTRASEIGRVGEAIVRLFHRLGNRENRARARLKYVLKKLGDDGFRAAYAEVRAEVDAEAVAELTLPSPPARTPAPPVPGDAARRTPEYLAWRASSVVAQKDAEHVAVYVRLLLGDVTSAQLRELGRVASAFGDGTVRLTIDQNILLPWVDKRSLPALFARLSEAGLARLDLHTARDVTSCQGADTCNLAVTSSRAVAQAVTDRLEAEGMGAHGDAARTLIKVSGCPNSCGQHHIADLGFHGGAKTVGGATVPVYQLHLGGGVDARGARFGRQVVKIVARRVPDAVVRLLELYDAERAPGESPAAFFERVDGKRVVAALGAIVTDPPRPDEIADVGESTGFLVQTGMGECAA